MSNTTIQIPEFIGAFRPCEHDEAVIYRAHMETVGAEAVSRVVEIMSRRGLVAASRKAHHYATLDLLASDGMDILDERAIPDEQAWKGCVELLDLRADSSDCRECAPSAFAATYGRAAS